MTRQDQFHSLAGLKRGTIAGQFKHCAQDFQKILVVCKRKSTRQHLYADTTEKMTPVFDSLQPPPPADFVEMGRG